MIQFFHLFMHDTTTFVATVYVAVMVGLGAWMIYE